MIEEYVSVTSGDWKLTVNHFIHDDAKQNYFEVILYRGGEEAYRASAHYKEDKFTPLSASLPEAPIDDLKKEYVKAVLARVTSQEIPAKDIERAKQLLQLFGLVDVEEGVKYLKGEKSD